MNSIHWIQNEWMIWVSDHVQGLQVVFQHPKQIKLLWWSQQGHYVSRSANGSHFDKTVMIKVNKSSHYKLTIHSITHSSVPRNRITKILNPFICTFIFTDRFNPEAKNPPKGPIVLANKENIIKCAWSSEIFRGPNVIRDRTGDVQV